MLISLLLFEDTNLCVIHIKRVTQSVSSVLRTVFNLDIGKLPTGRPQKDMELARRLRGRSS
jgi:hypothetical protein